MAEKSDTPTRVRQDDDDVDDDAYIVAIVDNEPKRHAKFHIFPGAHRRKSQVQVKHVYDMQEFATMMKHDSPHYLFMGGWLNTYTDWKSMCDIVLEAEYWPFLIILTTNDKRRAEEMTKYLHKYTHNLLIGHSPWKTSHKNWGKLRLEDRTYYYLEGLDD